MEANRGAHIDRISDLTSNVIDGILQHLPIRNVVRTSILSRKWRYMWVSVPRLQFDCAFWNSCYQRNMQNPEIGLTYLKLETSELSVPPKFCGFNCLLELHLSCIEFESEGAFERLVSGCPVLNQLTISDCPDLDCIHVSAPCLKVLHTETYKEIKSICFKKATNLTDLTLIMTSDGKEQVSVFDFDKGMPKIERLCLRSPCYTYIKMLSTGIIMQTLQNSINSLKYLELDGVDFNQSREILFIVSLLQSTSILVELVIKEPEFVMKEGYRPSVADAPLPEHMKEIYCNSCCLSQLRKVNITVGTAYEHALDLIRFLLANSPSLEILTFKVGLGLNQSDTPTILRISRDLLHMGRTSQRAEVEFLYDGLTEQ